jgi:ATP phosphoribosyltransferase regulatory subunit
MVYQPPVGARDLLPLDVAQKRWIEDRLQQVFQGWGYHRIITSTLERLDTLMAGGAIQRSTVVQLQDFEEDLGLRPELTASIARAAVTRMAGATHPLRLYYNANVFRRASETSHTHQQEFYQAGVELVGSSGLLADAEIVLLLAEGLRSLGLTQCSIMLGEAGLTRSLLSAFPPALQPKIRTAIAQLDRVTLETLPLSTELRAQALLLLDLRGTPTTVLQKAATLNLNTAQQATLNTLKSLVELLQSSTSLPLLLDLSLIRTFDYYTGIVFEAVGDCGGALQVLGQGGRYDQLLGVYHPQGNSLPGIGFSLQIETLHQMLLSRGQLPQQTPASDWLVVPQYAQTYPQALAYANQLRISTELVRVELALDGCTPAEIYDYVRDRRISNIAWIQPNGIAKVETIHQEN